MIPDMYRTKIHLISAKKWQKDAFYAGFIRLIREVILKNNFILIKTERKTPSHSPVF